jgi:hypothetical protein
MIRPNECKELPPVEYLRQCFDYNPETGSLTWRRDRPREHFLTQARWKQFQTQRAGKEAGCRSRNKAGKKLYVQTHLSNLRGRTIVGSMLMVHRICAAMGGHPVTKDVVVDHKNGDVWDHRLANLRVATFSQSSMNCRVHSDKKGTLPRGVFKNKRGGTYSARIWLGSFPTPELAYEAVCKAARLFHGEFSSYD